MRMRAPGSLQWRYWPWLALHGLLLLAGCGRTDQGPGETDEENRAGARASGGTSDGDQAGVGGSGGVSVAGSGGAAAGGSQPEPDPPADISGRWGLFVFNDPVGVQLAQTGSKLSGKGCAGGTPPLVEEFNFCGTIFGEVHGQIAHFGFAFSQAAYVADTVVSQDGQRMTGRFHGFFDVDWPLAWLRVPDQDPGLMLDLSSPSPALSGAYELSFEGTDDAGTEYTRAEPYRLVYRDGQGIASDFGAFWHTEIHQLEPNHSLEAGPVVLTSPELAIAMKLDADGQSFTHALVTTGSGHHYRFGAVRDP